MDLLINLATLWLLLELAGAVVGVIALVALAAFALKNGWFR